MMEYWGLWYSWHWLRAEVFRWLRLDTDFVVLDVCIGRSCLPTVQRWLLDAMCYTTGHLLRTLKLYRDNPDGSLPVYATYCRRCFKSGYIRGDYHMPPQ